MVGVGQPTDHAPRFKLIGEVLSHRGIGRIKLEVDALHRDQVRSDITTRITGVAHGWEGSAPLRDRPVCSVEPFVFATVVGGAVVGGAVVGGVVVEGTAGASVVVLDELCGVVDWGRTAVVADGAVPPEESDETTPLFP